MLYKSYTLLPKVSPHKPKPTLNKIHKMQTNSVKWSKEKLKSPHSSYRLQSCSCGITSNWQSSWGICLKHDRVLLPLDWAFHPALKAQPYELLTWHSAQCRGSPAADRGVSASPVPSPTQVPKPSPPLRLPDRHDAVVLMAESVWLLSRNLWWQRERSNEECEKT